MKAKGFTLLEVLVASLIMFLVVSIATQIYTSAVKSQLSAMKEIRPSLQGVHINNHIAYKARSGVDEGTGRWNGLDFKWSSRLISSQPILSTPVPGVEGNTLSRNASLMEVTVTLSSEQHSSSYQLSITRWE